MAILTYAEAAHLLRRMGFAGNPRFNVDFREVYAPILDRWLGADARAVRGASYPDVGFL